jgi:hypothetical protein
MGREFRRASADRRATIEPSMNEGRRSGIGLRLYSVGIGFATVFAAACVAGNPSVVPAISPSPAQMTPAPVSNSEPSAVEGVLGAAVTVAGRFTLTVVSAQTLVAAPAEKPAAGYRFVAIGIELIALRDGLLIDDSVLGVRDTTHRLFKAVGARQEPAIELPTTLADGEIASGFQTFELPVGGNYRVVVLGTDGASLAIIDTVSIAAAPTPTPGPPRAPTPKPVVAGSTPRPAVARATPAPAHPPTSGWTAAAQVTAAAYKGDVFATYDQAVRQANYEIAIAGFTTPGDTPAERAARIKNAIMVAAYNLMLRINSHFLFMNNNPPATCFADAYQADVTAGTALWTAAKSLFDNPGEGDLSGAMPARDAFLGSLDGYFSDCR